MSDNHMCNDKCFSKRNASKNIVPCMHCEKNFNVNCFRVTATDHIKFLLSNSNVNFVCDKCIDKHRKHKQSNRISSNALKHRLSAPSVEGNNKTKNANTSTSNNLMTSASKSNNSIDMTKEAVLLANSSMIDSSILHNTVSPPIADLLNSYSKTTEAAPHNAFSQADNHDSVSFSNNSHDLNQNRIFEMLNVIISKIDKLDAQAEQTNSRSQQNEHAINERSKDIDDKLEKNITSLTSILKTQTIDYDKIERITRSHACNNKVFNRNSIGGINGNNFAEWSFSLNNSINNCTNNDQNNDLYQLLHSLESNSWSAFDQITRTVNKIAYALKIDNSNESTESNSEPIRSPLFDSIQIDHLNKLPEMFIQLNEKYDSLLEILAEKALSNCEASPTVHSDAPDHDVNTDTVTHAGVSHGSAVTTATSAVSPDHDADLCTVTHAGVSHGLEVISSATHRNNHEFYLSKFKNTTTSAMILDYMRENGINDTSLSSVKIAPLVPRNRDVSSLSFISFKLDVNDELAESITKSNFWPQTCQIKQFVTKTKLYTDLAENISNGTHTKDFMAPGTRIDLP